MTRDELAERLKAGAALCRQDERNTIALLLDEAASALRSPSVVHETGKGARFRLEHEKQFRDVVGWLADEIVAAERGKATTCTARKRFAKDEAVNRLAQAIAALYGRRE